METVFNQVLKTGMLVLSLIHKYTVYKQQSIKSYKHSHRGKPGYWPDYGGRDLQSYTI